MASTTRRPGLHLAAVTSAMRDSALKMLARGCPPSALGTLLPSPHPEYLRALFLGDMARIDLFFQNEGTPATGNEPCVRIDVNGNNRVAYFEEWSIKEVLKEARAKRQSQAGPAAGTSNSEPEDEEDEEEAQFEQEEYLTRNQGQVSRAMAEIQDKINDWRTADQFRAIKHENALEVEVHDPLTRIPGAMESRVNEWREKLGWENTSTGFWFDFVPAVISNQKFKFFTYAPAKDSLEISPPDTGDSSGEEDEEVKYYWSNLSGSWKTAEGLQQETNKLQRDRNAWTVHQISRIERQRDECLEDQELDFVTTHLNGINGEHTSSGYKSASTGTTTGASWRRNNQSKKRVPTRGLACDDFEPGDGGETALEMLADADAADKNKGGGPEDAILSTAGDDAPLMSVLTPAVTTKRRTRQETQPVNKPKPKPKAKGKQKAKTATTTTAAKKTDTTATKRKRTEETVVPDEEAGPAKRTRRQAPKPVVKAPVDEYDWPAPPPISSPKPPKPAKRKGKAPPRQASSPEKKTSKTPASPVKGKTPAPPAKSKTPAPPVKSKTPAPPVKSERGQSPPAGTRKSSRVAAKKRKADDELEEDEVVESGSRAKTPAAAPSAKRQKKASNAASDVKDTREATLSAEPSHQSQATGTLKRLPTINELDGEGEKHEETAPNDMLHVGTLTTTITIDNANSTAQDEEEQLTPRGPTSQTYTLMSPNFSTQFQPLTLDSRAELIEMYPFLTKIPTNDPTTSPSSSPDPDSGNNTEDRREIWLKFLNFFGRFTSMQESLNRYFEQDGAVARERLFLSALERNIGRIRRVDDTAEHENDVEGGDEGAREERYVLL